MKKANIIYAKQNSPSFPPPYPTGTRPLQRQFEKIYAYLMSLRSFFVGLPISSIIFRIFC